MKEEYDNNQIKILIGICNTLAGISVVFGVILTLSAFNYYFGKANWDLTYYNLGFLCFFASLFPALIGTIVATVLFCIPKIIELLINIENNTRKKQ